MEAFVLLGMARTLVLTPPFSFVSKYLGQTTPTHPQTVNPAGSADVRLAIERASRYTPWTSNCLAQSLASSWMLGRRNMSAKTELGVRRDDKRALIAHSWTMCGEEWVTGKQGHEAFHVTQTFYR